jgi:hypothetical protein
MFPKRVFIRVRMAFIRVFQRSSASNRSFSSGEILFGDPVCQVLEPEMTLSRAGRIAPTPDPVTVYRPAHLDYVRDADRTLLVQPDTRLVFVLQGAEAALWSWLTLQYPYARLVAMSAALWVTSEEAAAGKLQAIFQQWVAAGILTQETGADG